MVKVVWVWGEGGRDNQGDKVGHVQYGKGGQSGLGGQGGLGGLGGRNSKVAVT